MTKTRALNVQANKHRKINAATRAGLRLLGRKHGHHGARPAPGAQPDALKISGDASATRITWYRYASESLEEQEVADVARLRTALADDAVDWIRVQGFGDEALLRALGEMFGIHPLALADVVNIPQRAKVDVYDDRLLVILRMARSFELEIELQQLSFVVGPHWVISFEEHAGDVFDPVLARIRNSSSSIRHLGPDFLAYALIDAVVDNFFPLLDRLSDMLDQLEEAAIGDPEAHTLARVHAVRRLLIHLERTQRQQRDALHALARLDHGPFSASVQPYLRDVEDHAIHMLDTIVTLREMALGVMDIYLSSVNNRTNDVMKTLTVVTSLFIPLTFLTGVYGMNFDKMPELHWPLGYVAAWGVIIAIALGEFVWFRRRGWLGARPPRANSTNENLAAPEVRDS